MVKKLCLFLLIMFSMILGSISFATTDVNKMNSETMQNIIDYIITKETTESTKTIYENVDINNLVNHFNTVTAPLLQAQGVEVLEQLILYYSDNNNYLLFIPNNNGIGDILPFAQINYSSSKNAYVLLYNSIKEVQLTITNTDNFTSKNYNTAETTIGQVEINYDNSSITSTFLCSVGFPATVNVKIANTTEFVWCHLYPYVDVYVASSGGTGGDGEDGGETGGDNGGDTGGGTTTTPDYNQDLDNIQTEIGNVNNNLENLGNKIESGNKEVVNQIEGVKDFLSGDSTITDNELLEKFPEVEIEDPSEDFFSWIFSQIENVFLSTEPQTFEFSLFTENKYSVSSEQIKVPDNAIKTLVGLSTAFGIFYWILKDVRKTINKIKEGSIEALANEDITADMV